MEMKKAEVDRLVEQIRHIILNKPIHDDLKSQSTELADVQEAIFYLSDCLSESNEFLKNLAKGNLDTPTPSRHNFLAGSLKELHSGLRHLTWQANQVASGDYNQRVSFLGEFSVSFNKMIDQLVEREQRLQQQSAMLRTTNGLMMSIMDGMKDWIIVTERETGEIVYTNQSAKQLFYDSDIGVFGSADYAALMEQLKQYKEDHDVVFDYSCATTQQVLRVRSFLIQWEETLAYAHYILDVTHEEEKREQIQQLAYKDELTGLYNRRYCIEQLDYLLSNQVDFTFCMIDLDGLKYANDNYGHMAGDRYLYLVAQEMRKVSRSTDIACRHGGDEFALIFPVMSNIEVVEGKMDAVNHSLAEQATDYPMSVSYGVVYVNKEDMLSAEEIMAQADEKMYIQKRWKKSQKKT